MSCTATRFLHCVNILSPVVEWLAAFTACFTATSVSYDPTAIQVVPIIYMCLMSHRISVLFIYLCIYLFHSIFILSLAWLYTTWEPCVAMNF